eukprot:17606-Heterococcus_DN1.PRE.2
MCSALNLVGETRNRTTASLRIRAVVLYMLSSQAAHSSRSDVLKEGVDCSNPLRRCCPSAATIYTTPYSCRARKNNVTK